MQAAAAMLVVAASLGLANIDLTYSRDGLSVSTGWMRHGAAHATFGARPRRPPRQSFSRGPSPGALN